MAELNSQNQRPSIDPKTGFCSETKIFHSLRTTITLPPENLSHSFADYALCLLRLSSSPESTLLIDSATGNRLSRDEIICHRENLAASLRDKIGLSKGDCAVVISPTSIRVPILYFALLSLGVVVAPINPNLAEPEISRLISLCKPVIAFSTSATASAHNLPDLRHKTVFLDSPEFDSMVTTPAPRGKPNQGEVKQCDTAAILCSSGTCGAVKGAVFSHRNLTSVLAGLYAERSEKASEVVVLHPVPLFHSYGFMHCVKSLVAGETMVLTEKFKLPEILRLVGEFKVTEMSLAPPALAMMAKSDGVLDGYDLSSLNTVKSGGVTLGKHLVESFRSRFPKLVLSQGYGLTESCGVAFRPRGASECDRFGSAGRLVANCEAKIVDPTTGDALPPCMHGELCIRGPMLMKGYIGDKQGSSTTLDSEGWLRTGDYCYIDSEGFLFVVDRLDDLFKYKDYQVSPAQLEEVLRSHPDIIDAGVIPFPSEEEDGEVPIALVIRRPESTLDEAQVIDFVTKQVEPAKKIRRVSFVDFIPKNPMGKISRKGLKKLLSS